MTTVATQKAAAANPMSLAPVPKLGSWTMPSHGIVKMRTSDNVSALARMAHVPQENEYIGSPQVLFSVEIRLFNQLSELRVSQYFLDLVVVTYHIAMPPSPDLDES